MNYAVTSAWAFARSAVGRLLLGACLMLALLWLAQLDGRTKGRAEERLAWRTRAASEAQRTEVVAARQAMIGASVGAAVVERQDGIRTSNQTLLREIPRYVTVQADARCDVPVGLVRLHDAAASGLPAAADAAGDPAEAASGLALSAVAGTVVDNYGACREAIEQLKGWQTWWSTVAREDGR